MTIRLQRNIIYGPVNSRRLGSSLGINLLSSERKICNFNCVYCQYDWTTIKRNDLFNDENYQDKHKVIDSLEKALFALTPAPNYITFSGNGEATLHPDFEFIVDEVIKLRDQYAPQSKAAILSNSVGVTNPKIIKALAKLDEPIMKLDCGDEHLMKFYNRPVVKTSLEEIVAGLKLLREVTIQSLFTDGPHGNYKPDNIKHWLKYLVEISPKFVQIYSLDRGYPSENIYPLNVDKLLEIKEIVSETGIAAEVF
ncbi:radical SAM protein [Calditrichota bacterium]